MSNHIHPLFVGYSRLDPDDENYMRANCSCTLIQMANNKNIIVDTMTAWDGDRIVASLAERGLKPSDIAAVVCTHGHSDHIGCNSLFLDAEWHIVGNCISNHDRYLNHNWGSASEDYFENGFHLFGDDVVIFQTPGHTLQCVSILVKNSQLGDAVGLAGDLFENAKDIEDANIWLEAGSDDTGLQRISRFRLAEMCDYIIPGHGEGFHVTDAIRSHLQEQLPK